MSVRSLLVVTCLLVGCKSGEPRGGFDKSDKAKGGDGHAAQGAATRGGLELESAPGGAPGGIGEGGMFRPRNPAAASATGSAAHDVGTRISCDRAISKALIDKYLPDATPQWGEPFENGEGAVITSCRLVDHGLKGGTIVRYKCGTTFSTEAHGEVPCVIEIDEMGEGQVADRAAFLADLEAALPGAVL